MSETEPTQSGDERVKVSSDAKPESGVKVKRSGGGSRRWILWLVIVILLALLGAGGYAGYRVFKLGQTRLSALDSRLTALEGEQRSLNDRAVDRDSFEQAHSQLVQRLGVQADRLDTLSNSLAELSTDTQGGRAAWARAEVRYLLRVANEELNIAHNVKGARAALAAADQRMQNLADPRMTAVRAAVYKEMTQLDALPDPDIEGMALSLGALAEQVDKLPLVQAERHLGAKGHGATGEADAGTWSRLWSRIKGVFDGMVQLRRTETPVRPLLPPKEEYFLYRNLQLELESARTALLNHDTANFRLSLNHALDWLDRYFQADSPAVRSMKSDLKGMLDASLERELPDISQSLHLLEQRYPGNQEHGG